MKTFWSGDDKSEQGRSPYGLTDKTEQGRSPYGLTDKSEQGRSPYGLTDGPTDVRNMKSDDNSNYHVLGSMQSN